ncbi:MAG: class I SAM-dependent methyltransferase [Caulobacteraceae bacterium]
MCRALHERGVESTGLDASDQLVNAARQYRGAHYYRMTYNEVIAGELKLSHPPHLVAANFSMLDDRVNALVAAIADVAKPSATLLIQAVHPFGCGGDYQDGWRLEMFAGHGDPRFRPMPWYFRTLASWRNALAPRWHVADIAEPREAGAKFPASILITARRT